MQIRIVAALLLMGAGANAGAMGVSLVATSQSFNVGIGDFVSLDVVMEFINEPTLGGGFNIFYDPNGLALDSFVSNNIGGFENRDPDLLDGVLQSWAFSDFNGLDGPLTVGSVTFEVIAATDSIISIEEDIGGIGGAFTSAVTFAPYLPGQLEFSGDIRVATYTGKFPLPAAVWFMLSGLAALFGFGRKIA